MSIPARLLSLGAVATLLCGAAAAQSTQTLPAGFDTAPGGSGSSWPFNTTSSTTWQWHYDSAQFAATGPIQITNISVRTLPTAGPTNNFDFPSLEVWMASSPTDYTVAGNGIQPGHSPTFANNLNPDLTMVRASGPFTGNAVPAQTWMSLDLTTPFVYDPTLGNDFVVELRNCGPLVVWGQSIDGKSGSAGQNGGNRYGSNTSCVETTSTLQNNEYVPIIQIEYGPVGPSLTISPCPGPGTLSMSGLTPGGPIAVAYAFAQGQTVIPGGACAGAIVSLAAPQVAPGFGPGQNFADANGDFSANVNLQPNWCGLLHVVGFDIASCTETNVVSL